MAATFTQYIDLNCVAATNLLKCDSASITHPTAGPNDSAPPATNRSHHKHGLIFLSPIFLSTSPACLPVTFSRADLLTVKWPDNW